MKSAYKVALLCFITGVVIISISSCKKGCTNPSAVNYDESAKQEDASCLYCDSTVWDVSESYTNIADYSSASNNIHYGDYVLRVNYKVTYYKFTGNGCNKVTGLPVCSLSTRYLTFTNVTVKNLTSNNIRVNGNLVINSGSSSVMFDSTLVNYVFTPNSTVTLANNYVASCISYTSSPSVYLNNALYSYF